MSYFYMPTVMILKKSSHDEKIKLQGTTHTQNKDTQKKKKKHGVNICKFPYSKEGCVA